MRRGSGVIIVNFEHISNPFLHLITDFEQLNVCLVRSNESSSNFFSKHSTNLTH